MRPSFMKCPPFYYRATISVESLLSTLAAPVTPATFPWNSFMLCASFPVMPGRNELSTTDSLPHENSIFIVSHVARWTERLRAVDGSHVSVSCLLGVSSCEPTPSLIVYIFLRYEMVVGCTLYA